MENWQRTDLRIAVRKKWCWRRFGARLEIAVSRWLVEELKWQDVVWDSVGKIDVTAWGRRIQMECKRLFKTAFTTKSWLRKNVVDRYDDDCWLKILVTTKRCWNDDCQAFLEANGVHVIEVGQINSRRQLEEAKEKFLAEFSTLVFSRLREEMEEEVCREKLSR
jgi:hypothetical protein